MSQKIDFLTLGEHSSKFIFDLIDFASILKKNRQKNKEKPLLLGKSLGMIFEKPSSRTRVSFDVAMFHLGGHAIELTSNSLGLGSRESIPDVARTLSRFVDAIVIRTFAHKIVEELAKGASVPVINGLTDNHHPCQALADGMTILEHGRGFKKTHLVYVGDGNNVLNSLIDLAAKTGMALTCCTPALFKPDAAILKAGQKLNANIVWNSNPLKAVKTADFIYTDVWASMGHEKELKVRRSIFKPFQINEKLVAAAPKHVKVMHCLPAHRGDEITDRVMDSPQSIVFDQAENRMHVQKALLVKLLIR